MVKKINPIMPHPCSNCPFRRDVPGFLSRPRARQIAESLLRYGESFTCHKTNEHDWGTGEAITTEKTRHCAGAALVLEAEEEPNQLMQVANRLGCYQKPTGAELVFNSLEEFVTHHDYERPEWTKT